MLNKKNSHKKINIVWFCLYKVSTVVKFRDRMKNGGFQVLEGGQNGDNFFIVYKISGRDLEFQFAR